MDNSKIYVGLDIGTTSVKVIICENVKGQLKVVGAGVEPSSGLSRGVIVDIDQTARAISRAVDKAASQSDVKVSSVVVGLPANYLQMKDVHGMITIAEKGQSHEIINQDVIDVAKSTLLQNVPTDREIIGLVPREFTVDGFDGIKDPRGMVGSRLEMQALLYSGPTTFVHNTKKAVEQAGLKIEDLVVGPIATGFNLLTDGEQDFGTLVIDMGGGQTTASIIHDHQLKYTSVDPEGGYYITKDISKVLNTSLRDAEKLKKDHGFADSSRADENMMLDVTVVGKDNPVEYSEKYLAEVIEARVRQIFQRISDRLDSIRAPKLPGGVVLLGGAAVMPGVAELASEYFSGKVKVYRPKLMGVRHPGFATALSLALYESRLSDVEQLIKQTVQQGESGSHQRRAVAASQKPASGQPHHRKHRLSMPHRSETTQKSETVQADSDSPKSSNRKKEGGLKSFFSNFFD